MYLLIRSSVRSFYISNLYSCLPVLDQITHRANIKFAKVEYFLIIELCEINHWETWIDEINESSIKSIY